MQIVRRVMLEASRIGDTQIEAGDHVLVFVGAANRDPARFAEPDRLDLERDLDGAHHTFVFGAFSCVGAPLARIEVAIGLERLFVHYPTVAPADDHFLWRDTIGVRGVHEMHLLLRSES